MNYITSLKNKLNELQNQQNRDLDQELQVIDRIASYEVLSSLTEAQQARISGRY